MYSAEKIDLLNGQPHFSIGERERKVDKGLGNLLTLYVLLERMEKRKILPSDIIRINETIANEAKNIRCIGYEFGKDVTAIQILYNLIVTDSPDSALAAANMIFMKTNKRPSQYFKELINKYELTSNIAENITGRKLSKKAQQYSMHDLSEIGKQLFELKPEYQNYLSISEMPYLNKSLLNSSFLIKNNRVKFGFFFGEEHSEAVCIGYENNHPYLYCVSGATNAFHRDYLVECLIEEYNPGDVASDGKDITVATKKSPFVMDIIGDTYPGEFYSKRRLARKRWDPLVEEGYDYSFHKLRSFFSESDFRIANLEAALVHDVWNSPLFELKKFVLGGKPNETIQALKNAHIDAVTLANNHAMDFGKEGLFSTLSSLKENGIYHTGAGLSGKEANTPIRMNCNGKNIIIYSAYWYRMGNHRYFDFYATPSKCGVNTLEGELIEAIQNEKKHDPNCFVLVIPHWGVDFLMVKPYQRTLATRLVDAGADLIVGHGPHTLQKIEEYQGVPIIYSIGNGVFNSDGEYDGYPQSTPYGMIARLSFIEDSYTIELHPIYANNRETKWQPSLVDTDAFKEVIAFFEKNRSNLNSWEIDYTKNVLVYQKGNVILEASNTCFYEVPQL